MATPTKKRPTHPASSVKPSKIRKRCDNCGGLFPRTRKDRRFCKDECRKEFNRFGAAYGPLKQKLEKLIAQQSRASYQEVTNQLREIVDCLARLEVRIAHVERKFAAAKAATD